MYIAIIIIISIFLCSMICFIYLINRNISLFIKSKMELMKVEESISVRHLDELGFNNKLKSVKYSDELLKFIRNIIAQIAIFKMRTFKDGKDLDKITETNIMKVAESVAVTSISAIKKSIIGLEEQVLFTEDFLDQYIVETSIIIVKDLTNKMIKEHNEEETY